MPEPWSDDDLRRELAELRRQDERSAPDFESMWARARADAVGRRVRRRVQLVAAAALVLMVAGAVLAARSRGRTERPSAAELTRTAPLSQWRSPTAFLLDGATSDLLRTVPLIPALPLELRIPSSTRTHRGDS